MRPLRFVFAALLLFAGAESIHAAACTTASLTTYDAGGFSCTMGTFTLDHFTFASAILAGSPVPLTDSSVTVMPNATNTFRFGFTFSVTGWSVTTGQKLQYTITYDYDPGPIRSMEDLMSDPPTGSGKTTVFTNLCLGTDFVGCSSPMTSVTVSDPGATSNSVFFTPPASGVIGVQQTITLDASAGGAATADLLSFGSNAVIPEPGTLAGGLLALALTVAKLRAKRL